MEFLYNFGIFAQLCEGKVLGALELGLMSAVSVILCIAAGYLLGSINTSIIVSKVFFGEDVRNYGSGNAGATNVLRTYGKRSAVLTLLGDVLKTVIAVLIGRFIGFPIQFFALYGESALYPVSFGGFLAGFFTIVGHTFPLYYKFKGGKGVLCAATVVAMLSPWTFVWLFLIFLIIVLGTKFVSLGSVIAVMAYPVLYYKLEGKSICVLFTFMIAGLVVYNHRSNIRRLLDGTENRFSIGKKDSKKSEKE